MTVAELIEKLKEMPQDAICYFKYDGGYACGIIGEVENKPGYDKQESAVVLSEIA